MKILLHILIISLVICGCESVDIPEVDTDPLIVVEGWLTDQEITQSIRISYSSNFLSRESNPSIPDAEVYILAVSPINQIVRLVHQKSGYYHSQTTFAAKPNVEYQLRIVLSDNSLITSKYQKINDLSVIDSLYVGSYERESLEDPDILETIFYPIISTDDSADLLNFYRWKVSRNDTLFSEPESISILADQFFDGNSISHELTSFEFKQGDVIYVEQQQLSKSAFDFMSLVRQQTTLLGTVNSTSPASIDGNMAYEDGSRKALGYWGVISVDTSFYTIP